MSLLTVTVDTVGPQAACNDPMAAAAIAGGISMPDFIRSLLADRDRLLNELMRRKSLELPPPITAMVAPGTTPRAGDAIVCMRLSEHTAYVELLRAAEAVFAVPPNVDCSAEQDRLRNAINIITANNGGKGAPQQ